MDMTTDNQSIIPASIDNKPILRNLMQLYLHDFSIYDGADVNAQGLYEYPYLDLYWVEQTRFPFLIQIEGKYAGFILIRHGCYNFKTQKEDDSLLSIAEFFIIRKYRRQGVGRWTATQAFDQFVGMWQVNAHNNNLPAQAFWKTMIDDYTHSHYDQFSVGEEIVFQFTSPTQ